MSYNSFCTCAEQPPEPGSPQANTVPSKNTTAIAWVNNTLNKKHGEQKLTHSKKDLDDSISDIFWLTSVATQNITKQAFIIPAGTAHPLTAGSWVQPQDQQQVSFHRPKSITGRSVHPVVWFFLLYNTTVQVSIKIVTLWRRWHPCELTISDLSLFDSKTFNKYSVDQLRHTFADSNVLNIHQLVPFWDNNAQRKCK